MAEEMIVVVAVGWVVVVVVRAARVVSSELEVQRRRSRILRMIASAPDVACFGN